MGMSWFLLLKFVHVVAVILWLGGGAALVIAATISSSFEAKRNVIGVVTLLSHRLFIPALVVVLLSGLAMWWIGSLTFDAWVAYGLVGILLTGVIGAGILGPAAEKLDAMAAASTSQREMAAPLNRLLRGAQADLIALASIVFAMVVKPTWADTGLLFGMIAVVAIAAAFLLARKPSPQTA